MAKHELSEELYQRKSRRHLENCQCDRHRARRERRERREKKRERKLKHQHHAKDGRQHKRLGKEGHDINHNQESQKTTESKDETFHEELTTITQHLQTRISAMHKQISSLQDAQPMFSESIEAYEQVVRLALEHITDVITHELALRDELEEQCLKLGWSRHEVLTRYTEQFVRMVRKYDAKHCQLLQGISPDVTQRAARK